MVSDRKLFLGLLILLLLPLTLAIFGGDRFRYPCQDPKNWDKEMCKMPYCDVTRTCPEHIFKGQRDPRLGPPETRNQPLTQTGQTCHACPPQGVNNAK
jgi:hypothetical protein